MQQCAIAESIYFYKNYYYFLHLVILGKTLLNNNLLTKL